MGGEPPSGSLPRSVCLRSPAQMPVGDEHDAFALAGVTNVAGLSVFKLETRGGTPRVCRLSSNSLQRARSSRSAEDHPTSLDEDARCLAAPGGVVQFQRSITGDAA